MCVRAWRACVCVACVSACVACAYAYACVLAHACGDGVRPRADFHRHLHIFGCAWAASTSTTPCTVRRRDSRGPPGTGVRCVLRSRHHQANSVQQCSRSLRRRSTHDPSANEQSATRSTRLTRTRTRACVSYLSARSRVLASDTNSKRRNHNTGHRRRTSRQRCDIRWPVGIGASGERCDFVGWFGGVCSTPHLK